MSSVQGVHFAAFADEYKAILASAETVMDGLPPLLRQRAKSLVPQLLRGDFCQIVALLPYWVGDLLDGCRPAEKAGASLQSPWQPPAQDEHPQTTQALGLSQLLGCWSYLIQDGVLDGQMVRPELLPLATAFHAAAIGVLERLLPGDQAFWRALERLALRTAEAQCRELGQRTREFPDLEPAVASIVRSSSAEAWSSDLEGLADRAALLQVAVAGGLALRGYPQDHPRGVSLRRMLRQYCIARQIGDDRTDWLEDLRQGQVNFVAARIARRMKASGAVQAYAELDVERMTAYYLYDEDLFADIQRAAMEACQKAAEAIAPYRSLYLGALVDELADRLGGSYEVALVHRFALRNVLAPLQGAAGDTAPAP